jgi:hypothetical protein
MSRGSEDSLSQCDLAITTDFRDVFAECVTSHLGAKDISKIFQGHTYGQKLGFIKS